MTTKRKKAVRVRFNGAYVKPATIKAIKRLARRLDISEGKVLDKAIIALVEVELLGAVNGSNRPARTGGG